MLTPGQSIGRFQIREHLGSGGMGDVYRGHDPRLGRDVAIKLLPAERATDPDRLARFEREARALAALSHPGIVTIYSVEEAPAGPSADPQGSECASPARLFLTMELVEGEGLDRVIPPEGLPADRFLDLSRSLLAAMAAAHARGVVHRDLKPGNVMIDRDGRLKVLDFGLAKLLTEPVGEMSPSALPTLTREGMTLGTLPYMAPEQVRGEATDERTDIFALGAMLYEMATGRRPFEQRTSAELISAILRDQPTPVAASHADLPAGLDELLRTCFAKEPAQRYRTAIELEEAFAGLPGSPATPSRPITPRSRPRQEIRFATAPDGVHIAYSELGQGPTLVKAANWLNHLEYDWNSPVWHHLLAGLAERSRLVRYDGRGTGLSDWEADDISFDAFVQDLTTVVEAAELDRFALLGVSQGCAISIAYAVRNPQRVSHLILYAGFARAWAGRTGPGAELMRAMQTLMETGWKRGARAYRQAWTSLFIPDGTPDQMQWFNELQRVCTQPRLAGRIISAVSEIDVTELLGRVEVPTLVLHRRDDAAVPFSSGRRLATGIPGAHFVPLEGSSHVPLPGEPEAGVWLAEIRDFLGVARPTGPSSSSRTPRL